MKYVVGALVVCLVGFTALAMAMNPSFKHIVLASVGPFPVYIFDALLAASTAVFLFLVSLRTRTNANAANRAVLRITGAYVLYQLVVVMPVAVLFYGVHLGGAYTYLDVRLALVLIPFFYYVGLRYVSPERMVALVNAAAVALLLYAIYRYVSFGPQGAMEEGVYRLRLLWGGSTLLFGWLTVTGLWLQKRSVRAYAAGLAGILGIALVNHRSGYVALIFALVAHALMVRRISSRVVTVLVLVTAGGILLGAASPVFRESASYSLRTMFNPRADATAADRVNRSVLAWDYIQQYPLGDYVWTRRYYLVDLGSKGFEPHNFVVAALDTQGWVSAGLLFALVSCVFWVGWSMRRRSKLGSTMTTYLVFYMTFCLFNTTFDTVENIALFALAVALVLHANSPAQRPRLTTGMDSEEGLSRPPRHRQTAPQRPRSSDDWRGTDRVATAAPHGPRRPRAVLGSDTRIPRRGTGPRSILVRVQRYRIRHRRHKRR